MGRLLVMSRNFTVLTFLNFFSSFYSFSTSVHLSVLQVKQSASDREQHSAAQHESESVFEDSMLDSDHHLTVAVRQCRQHIDDIGREAAGMEQLLNELASTSPQRGTVLDAVQKLDSLRRHINSTQELLSNVDAMVCACEQTQQKDSQPSRTELLQRELGRLNSRLCCTVLALERAMSKAVCRGTQSGVVVAKPLSDAAVTVQSQPAATSSSTPGKQTPSQRTGGVCEQWLESQQRQTVEPDVACRSETGSCSVTASSHPSRKASSDRPQSTTAANAADALSGPAQVSLQEIHRMLGDIITDIDQPPPSQQPDTDDHQQTTPAENIDEASNPSVMTDSVAASSTDLFAADQTSSIRQLSER